MRTALTFVAVAAALSATALAATPPASQWEIGPVIRGKVYSRGMPAAPTALSSSARDGWSFDFPHASRAAGHVHYVSFDPGTLAGKSRIVVRYRVDAARGVRFVPQEFPDRPAILSLAFQRAGDNWSAKGPYEHYRWYSPRVTAQTLTGGVRTMTVSLTDPDWISVMAKPASANPRAFRDAKQDTGRIGLVFGSDGGRGHGVYATGPARFTLLSFDVI